MPAETVNREWTLVSWLIAHAADHSDAIVTALGSVPSDAIVLQSIREQAAGDIAAALGMHVAWEMSHHPKSRLIPGSAVGLATLTRHRLTNSASAVIGDAASAWSKHRRIAQFAVIDRDDATNYTLMHGVGVPRDLMPNTPAPLVRFRPEQVGVDAEHAVDLPAGAIRTGTSSTQPVDGAAEMFSVTFEMPWVKGDFDFGAM